MRVFTTHENGEALGRSLGPSTGAGERQRNRLVACRSGQEHTRFASGGGLRCDRLPGCQLIASATGQKFSER
jgi:hypothetical protein